MTDVNQKFKRDSIWIARDGSERRVICVDAEGGSTPIVSYSWNDYHVLVRHDSDGRCPFIESGREADYDLIREKREPREFWVDPLAANPKNGARYISTTPVKEWIKVREVL